MTVHYCIKFCSDEGYKFAGLESGNECFCGNHAPFISAPQRECHLNCSGNTTQICGGFWRMSVYFIPRETTTVYYEVTTLEEVPTTQQPSIDVISKREFSLSPSSESPILFFQK